MNCERKHGKVELFRDMLVITERWWRMLKTWYIFIYAHETVNTVFELEDFIFIFLFYFFWFEMVNMFSFAMCMCLLLIFHFCNDWICSLVEHGSETKTTIILERQKNLKCFNLQCCLSVYVSLDKQWRGRQQQMLQLTRQLLHRFYENTCNQSILHVEMYINK